MKIIIFDGTFKTTTFINRLIEGLSLNHEVFVLGFNESVKSKITGVHYVGLGSNTSTLIFVLRSVKLRAINFINHFKLVIQLSKGLKSEISQDNFQLAIDAIQPDIIHFQWVSVLSYLENLKLPKCTKTILSQRGFHINVRPFVNLDNMLFLKVAFQKLDGFHSVSKAIQKKSNEIYTSPSKIDHVIYSGFDYKHIPVRENTIFSKPIRIISVGRNHWKKDYRSAINAIYLLKNRGLNCHYTIIGVQKDEELLFLVSELGLQKEITFSPRVTQEEVYNQMLEADLFILPSVEEGIANVCIEAMFCKLLVLSTNCGGMSELIEDGITGFLVPTRAPDLMAQKIENIMQLSNDKISEITMYAREKVKQQHNSLKMINDMGSLYREVYERN